jgi:hypothetical protein
LTTKLKKKQVISDLLGVYLRAQDEVMASKRDATRIKFLRPSQMPFCPAGFFVQHATQGMIATQNMMSAYFTSVGTTVHEVVQRYLSPSGRFLADWRCKICGKWRRMSTKSECCDFTMEYHEVLIDHKGVVGHIDAIFKDSKGRYWILDFKTCTVSGASYKQKSPGAAYKEQVETYALMLYRQYGIKVEGVMLMFIPRDDPTKPSVWVNLIDEKDLKRVAKRVKKYKQQHKEALHAETLEEAVALAEYGKCKGEWCRICRSGVSLKEQLRKAYKTGKKLKHLPLINLK